MLNANYLSYKEAKSDVVLNIDGGLYLRIASTKEEAEAKVFAKTLVAALTPLLKDGVTIEGFVVPSRFGASRNKTREFGTLTKAKRFRKEERSKMLNVQQWKEK